MFNNESGQLRRDFGPAAIAKLGTFASIPQQSPAFAPPAIYLAAPKEHLHPSAFQVYGGTTTAQEMEDLMRLRVDQPVSVVARWIASRQVVAFRWRGELLLPLFQFDLAHMHTRPGVEAILSELVGVMDEDECAAWFVQVNGWLDGEAPAEVIASAPDLVVAAARAYRFVVTG